MLSFVLVHHSWSAYGVRKLLAALFVERALVRREVGSAMLMCVPIVTHYPLEGR